MEEATILLTTQSVFTYFFLLYLDFVIFCNLSIELEIPKNISKASVSKIWFHVKILSLYISIKLNDI